MSPVDSCVNATAIVRPMHRLGSCRFQTIYKNKSRKYVFQTPYQARKMYIYVHN